MSVNKNLVVAFAVLIMMAMPFSAIFADDSDADPVVAAPGTYSVYVYNGSSWSSEVVNAYDAAMAVKATSMWVDDSTSVDENGNAVVVQGDEMVDKYEPATASNPYVTYNWATYGNITKFMGLENNDNGHWNIFKVDCFGMVSALTDNLGSYKCFSDYDSNHQMSNIVLYYGSNLGALDVQLKLSNYTNKVAYSDIISVTESAEYMVTFNLHIDLNDSLSQLYKATSASQVFGTIGNIEYVLVTDNNLKNHTMKVVGYGSDCYLALKDAVNTSEDVNKKNLTGIDAVPGSGYTAYGWMTEMFGLGTIQTAGTTTENDWTDDTYAYWCIYDTPNHMSDFGLGAYSPLSNSGDTFSVNNFDLIFKEVIMQSS